MYISKTGFPIEPFMDRRQNKFFMNREQPLMIFIIILSWIPEKVISSILIPKLQENSYEI
jgi:hypothetical protein